MRLPTLRTAPHYFIIDSIGGMNEGYSETTCRRIEDVVAPEYGKAMVEEYLDQWMNDRALYYNETYDLDLKFNHEECTRGGWHNVTPLFPPRPDRGAHFQWDQEIEEFQTLFVQVYDGVMLGDGAVVYDQMDDSVQTICPRHTAMRVAEEAISIEVERMKEKLYSNMVGKRPAGMKFNVSTWELEGMATNLIQAYDSLADAVRCLEFPQACMVDVDDTCLHFFPTEAMRVMTYNGNNVIITL